MNRQSTSPLDHYRSALRELTLAPERMVIDGLLEAHPLDDDLRARAGERAVKLVRAIRDDTRPGVMEVFLAEYGLSTEEGVALMCLAEALLRVPDADTIDALIEDKIAPSEWGTHLGKSSSSLVNASTWALMLTGKVLREDRRDGVARTLHGAVKRLGEPVIRTAVGRAMRELGHQFVLGRDIGEAVKRGKAQQAKGYTYSYDMLGEAALTYADAQGFHDAYADAIARIAKHCDESDIRDNPGISIKLSALHPRYEVAQKDRVMAELVPRAIELALAAKRAGMGLNVDAEEADRLDLSLDVIEAVLAEPELAGWDGFGVVVQAYGKRAGATIDWLHALAARLDRRIMVRLVKGAYWDTEIKRAQVEGLSGFPVFTHKAATDVSYLTLARKLLGLTDRIYPQFATHNAHSVATILEMSAPGPHYEFQRLHGMGAALHDLVMREKGARCRIYAPVGAHRDLLAYLVRRLLENGANSSFVNQIVDEDVPAEVVAADPLVEWQAAQGLGPGVVPPAEIFAPRDNSRGFDLTDPRDLEEIEAARAPFATHVWQAAPLIAGDADDGAGEERFNPARPGEVVGRVRDASDAEIARALDAARPWDAPAEKRAEVLRHASYLMEDRFGEIFALLTREAGKTLMDGVAELREAVDFLRYYAGQAGEVEAPAGVFACISPWNFPLAIFCGQIAAALAAGNGVIAKPAGQSPLIAHRAVELLHEAGVPRTALQLLPGDGARVGGALASDARIDGLCFTGSTATAKRIDRAMAEAMAPEAPLIAETGGLNAMIVDSTALPEQAVRDIVASAFQSAGQRCSACRMLYVQEDVAGPMLAMLEGAMDAVVVGDPWHLSTDVGPVIDAAARDRIEGHVAKNAARVRKRLVAPGEGTFVAPTLIEVDGIADLEEEIFGPVLHVATYRADQLDAVVDAINATGYGLTFGMHSRIDDRVQRVCARVAAGNLYINRNQIGAIVGSQPFGGEGLSGTGPKAGGPAYVPRFGRVEVAPGEAAEAVAESGAIRTAIEGARPVDPKVAVTALPGPTGESNRLTTLGRGTMLCLGPTRELAARQKEAAEAAGCAAVVPDRLPEASVLSTLDGFDGVICDGPEALRRLYRQALAARDGAILPLMTLAEVPRRARAERHVCIDTTAAGGNAQLLAASG
ncbi:bifunctional proline dehydrogenase/L-glutamate gamma-semialdehyde dehydrogenase PutA [Roseobacter sp. HKCCA0434]|uniref:bifunctional proline dehydrogenase/L-glutamate gamma-semialdehyde dehydrogenase PutA n=1 Tax=Roseobacter sp. HKCCA0434 TaxID=3079297 RepID=UPI002905DB60|nr:bifunctional proline dehydrogenase/L-glutamate gamma-semialdehyde dehydrogenase PutA [Roseobacter sp. HKCCA0434]